MKDSVEVQEQLDSRVIPVMREAVATVQLVVFGFLKEKLREKYITREPDEYRRLIGCIVSDIFGTPSPDPDSVRFARENLDVIEQELREMAVNLPQLLPILTDALRMQTLCDHEQGVNSLPTLLRARALGLLLEERTIPMPSTFMISVRKVGAEHGLLRGQQANQSPEA